ncbi:similar to Saccharomyces cerevisiae YKL108W SLD2 Single-stranded DNA origin-binding and annealing protein [Maudiozyma barnettii]|uniref:DNA replication regulator SLD2 n=1 Tax=Maudiozyma barnettii TaxID=61262 RepID=A0A8H2VKP9_9SACH|nr:Sld2p [Kazachstania barnettii]CAB4257146.1 similar to Saccharomyces cerevisiae YKL108W SLD2 Single-stranded DNA origin-binding and annealing protein [Kazachstania barnettii]CAD1779516.1 similar to Saccharomyces cerevisiae YKL108W SLD2 Single-stranded DNA origin-binding and annealing protein [Kazachstania barnettii]
MSTKNIQLISLRKELKDWEHNFINIQHRSPTKTDINANPTIQYKYKQYSQLKRKQTKTPSLKATKIQRHSQKHREIRSPIVKHDENNTVIEIGPTPQIFGKSISIFELNLSPVKRKLQIPDEMNGNLGEQSIDGESAAIVGNNIFGMDFNDSPFIEDSIDIQPLTEPSSDSTTISSMVPDLNKLMIPMMKKYGPNSPLKLPIDLSVQIRPRTPNEKRRIRAIQENSSDSSANTPPSLWKRNISKSLRDLEDEYLEASKTFVPKQIHDIQQQQDTKNTNSKDNLSANDANDEDRNIIPKGKRRKFRIRRFEDKSTKMEGSTTIKINLHKRMHKLKKKQLRKIMKDLDMEDQTIFSESEDESDHNEDQVSSQKKKPSRKKKYNLVSNNFRRLKLPSKKRNNFTKRFHRR